MAEYVVKSKPSAHIDNDEDICHFCCNKIYRADVGHFIVVPCSHQGICATCLIRLRFLVMSFECAFCKAPQDKVVVTRKRVKSISESALSKYHLDDNIGVYFESVSDLRYYRHIRSIYCVPCEQAGVDVVFSSLKRYKSHLEKEHQLFICSVCSEQSQSFTKELTLYSKAELQTHIKHGTPATLGSAAIESHPYCEFCLIPFYNNDLLYIHLTTNHCYCHFCHQHKSQKYYRDYKGLERHFAREHFPCQNPACLKKRNVVFKDSNSLRAHEYLEHTDKSQLSQSQKRQASRLVIDFGTSDRHQTDSKSMQPDRPSMALTEAEFPSLDGSNPSPNPITVASYRNRSPRADDFPALVAPNRPHRKPASRSAQKSKNSLVFQDKRTHRTNSRNIVSYNGAASTTGNNRAPAQTTSLPTSTPTSLPTSTPAQTTSLPISVPPPPPWIPGTPIIQFRNHRSLPLPPACAAADVNKRNQKLVDLVKTVLGGCKERYDQFKHVSKCYRLGLMSAADYYLHFGELFRSHPQEAELAFLQLISLLPDTVKRMALHAEYSQDKHNQRVLASKCNSGPSSPVADVSSHIGDSSNSLISAADVSSNMSKRKTRYRKKSPCSISTQQQASPPPVSPPQNTAQLCNSSTAPTQQSVDLLSQQSNESLQPTMLSEVSSLPISTYQSSVESKDNDSLISKTQDTTTQKEVCLLPQGGWGDLSALPITTDMIKKLKTTSWVHQDCIELLNQRFGNYALSRISIIKRREIVNTIQSLQLQDIHDFSCLNRLGLSSKSTQLLTSVMRMQNLGANVFHDWSMQSLIAMTVDELWLLFEYFELLLSKFCDPSTYTDGRTTTVATTSDYSSVPAMGPSKVTNKRKKKTVLRLYG